MSRTFRADAVCDERLFRGPEGVAVTNVAASLRPPTDTGRPVQVLEQDVRDPARRPSTTRHPWTVALLALALAVPLGVALVERGPLSADVPVLLAVFLTAVAAEWVNVHIEFRHQSFVNSASELAFVIALLEIGGFWTAVTRAAAVGVVLGVQRFSRAKLVFNVAVAVIDSAVAVAVLGLLPVGDITEPATWVSCLVAVFAANVVAATMVAGAIVLTQGYPGPAMWTSLFTPVVVVSPVAALVGLAVLMLLHTTVWSLVIIVPLAVALVLLYRRFAAVTREGNSLQQVYEFARRVEEVRPDEAGTRQIVHAVRELLNAERVALWLPPYLDEGPRLVVATEHGSHWYDGPGDPDDPLRRRAVASSDGAIHVSAARADEEEAAALARRGVSDLLGDRKSTRLNSSPPNISYAVF